MIAFAVLSLYDLLALEFVGRLREARTADASAIPQAGTTQAAGVGFRRAGFAGLIAYGISQTLGFSALTGTAVRYRLWSALGLSTPETARAARFVGATFMLGLVLVSGLALVLEPATALTPLHVPPVEASAAGALLLFAALS
jgi:uncharacterized membrane protein YbhN (UPF0104 family)